MDRQEFINKYLDTIIRFRKEYLLWDIVLKTASANEFKEIVKKQQSIAENLIRFILRPQSVMEIDDSKLIENLLNNKE